MSDEKVGKRAEDRAPGRVEVVSRAKLGWLSRKVQALRERMGEGELSEEGTCEFHHQVARLIEEQSLEMELLYDLCIERVNDNLRQLACGGEGEEEVSGTLVHLEAGLEVRDRVVEAVREAGYLMEFDKDTDYMGVPGLRWGAYYRVGWGDAGHPRYQEKAGEGQEVRGEGENEVMWIIGRKAEELRRKVRASGTAEEAARVLGLTLSPAPDEYEREAVMGILYCWGWKPGVEHLLQDTMLEAGFSRLGPPADKMPHFTMRLGMLWGDLGRSEWEEAELALMRQDAEVMWPDVLEWGEPVPLDESLVDEEFRARSTDAWGVVVEFEKVGSGKGEASSREGQEGVSRGDVRDRREALEGKRRALIEVRVAKQRLCGIDARRVAERLATEQIEQMGLEVVRIVSCEPRGGEESKGEVSGRGPNGWGACDGRGKSGQ